MAALPNSTIAPFGPIEPSYGTDSSTEYKVRRVDYGDGYSARAAEGLNSVAQTWNLTWDNLPDADSEALRVFFAGLKGVGVVDWTPFNQATALKWTASRFRSKPSGYQVTSCSVTLRQEFDL